VPERVFLMGPNHSGVGADFSVVARGEWETPLGSVPIDEDFAGRLLASSDDIKSDEAAHRHEHCLEVQIPFLQSRNSGIKICPLVIGSLDLLTARQVALACGRVLNQTREPVLTVVSTDMNHYETDEATRKKDQYALQAIENLDEEALAGAVKEYRITMCGFVPVYMLLAMRELLGIKKARLVDYRTSADASGDRNRVVGYAGFIFE